jgi:putative transcriptional regulator
MIEIKKGIVLIAEPFLKDPNFSRTVIILCEHNNEGSIGFVLNKPFAATLEDLIPELQGLNWPIFYGGPVEPDSIHFLHNNLSLLPDSNEITDGIFWSSDFRTLIALLKEGKVQQNDIRLYLGYSGWGQGQLQDELNEKTWVIAKAESTYVFDMNATEIWTKAMMKKGGDYKLMANFPTDPQLN